MDVFGHSELSGVPSADEAGHIWCAITEGPWAGRCPGDDMVVVVLVRVNQPDGVGHACPADRLSHGRRERVVRAPRPLAPHQRVGIDGRLEERGRHKNHPGVGPSAIVPHFCDVVVKAMFVVEMQHCVKRASEIVAQVDVINDCRLEVGWLTSVANISLDIALKKQLPSPWMVSMSYPRTCVGRTS